MKKIVALILSLSIVSASALSAVSAEVTGDEISTVNEAGDVNGDGKVDVTDLSVLSIALADGKGLAEAQLKAADVDRDGKAALSDLARIRQYLSKVIVSLDSASDENNQDNTDTAKSNVQKDTYILNDTACSVLTSHTGSGVTDEKITVSLISSEPDFNIVRECNSYSKNIAEDLINLAMKRNNCDFFNEGNRMIYLFVEEYSGSIEVNFNHLEIEGNNITVYIDEKYPCNGWMTDDMSYYNILITVPAELLKDMDETKPVNLKAEAVSGKTDAVLTEIVDLTMLNNMDVPAAEEVFYTDDDYTYVFLNVISNYIECRFSDGSTMMITEALESGKVSVSDLDKYGIFYMKYDKSAYKIVK
ncbi:MAG: dockerin type I repeat-containing protein [Oscillospiraceae bacterium]|nr:dockerin type I repeat-containing protein [Oscillospiraceae bacterium]